MEQNHQKIVKEAKTCKRFVLTGRKGELQSIAQERYYNTNHAHGAKGPGSDTLTQPPDNRQFLVFSWPAG